jgi:hypothetical protein
MVRKTVPPLPPDGGSGDDSLALKEQRAFDEGDYDKQSKQNEFNRSETVKTVLHYVAVAIFLEFVLVYMVLLAVWAWHLILPPDCWFLAPTQFEKVQAIVLSGVVASALSKYYERYMK